VAGARASEANSVVSRAVLCGAVARECRAGAAAALSLWRVVWLGSAALDGHDMGLSGPPPLRKHCLWRRLKWDLRARHACGVLPPIRGGSKLASAGRVHAQRKQASARSLRATTAGYA